MSRVVVIMLIISSHHIYAYASLEQVLSSCAKPNQQNKKFCVSFFRELLSRNQDKHCCSVARSKVTQNERFFSFTVVGVWMMYDLPLSHASILCFL